MADTAHVSLMLGPFEDRELEPHEYQEVAFHLARCEECRAELADYGAIGRELRTLPVDPPLDGFKDAVMRRIDALPVPLGVRLRRLYDRIGGLFPSGLGMAVAGAVAAAITVVLVTPYAQLAMHQAAPIHEIAKAEPALAVRPGFQTARHEIARESGEAGEEPEAVISKLESDIPSIAVWNEPQMSTTVIWLPDQQ